MKKFIAVVYIVAVLPVYLLLVVLAGSAAIVAEMASELERFMYNLKNKAVTWGGL